MDDRHTQTPHPISAVLADIDGTLVTRDKVLTQKAIQAVNERKANSRKHVAAHRLPCNAPYGTIW